MCSIIKLWNCLCTALIAVISVHLVETTEINVIADLSVTAVPFDKHALQLSIKWKSTNKNGTKFDVKVMPDPDEYCPFRTCSEYGITLNSTEVLLPRDPMPLVEHKECSIEPSCNYTIKVYSNTNHSMVMYQVPGCVGDICSCRHIKQLPNMTLISQLNAKEITIGWNVTPVYMLPDDVRLEAIAIRVGTQKNPTLTWGGQYRQIDDFQIPINNSQSTISTHILGSHTVHLGDEEPPGSRFLIRGHIIDSRGCRGFDANYTISVPQRTPNDANQSKIHHINVNYFIVIVMLVMMVMVLLLCTIPRYIKMRRKKNNTMLNWRGIYHNVPSGHEISQITMQENCLYVDKDILEARARGEADLMEVAHKSLTIGREIGKGAFGRVCIATAENLWGKQGSEIVAVKQLKKRPTADELEEFLSEIATMKKVGRHPNVVTLLGCCTIKQPLCMIMEYVGCGDLLHYLRQLRAQHEARSTAVSGIVRPAGQMDANLFSIQHSNSEHFGKYLELFHSSSKSSNATSSDASYHRRQSDNVSNIVRPSLTETMYTLLSDNPEGNTASVGGSINYVLDHKELHKFAIQIARGMSHLETKQITHRDLAARNILIDETKTLKISDFGLSRSGIYVNTRNKRVPLRWLSLEAVRDSLYSSKSDVWAFGIVLWEIGTLGGFPYPNVSNQELLSYLSAGQRLQRPENCSEDLYAIMQQCWQESPESRPSFHELVAKLEPQHKKIYVDFDELEPDYVFPPTLEMLKNNNTKSHVRY